MSEEEIAEEIEFFYVCHKCNKRIKASSPSNIDAAKCVPCPSGKKHHYVFECQEDCSKDKNGVE